MRIAKSGIAQLRRHRARGLAARRGGARRAAPAIRRSSSWSRSRSATSRANVSSCEIEIRSTVGLELARVDPARAVAQRRAPPCRGRSARASRRRAPRARRSSSRRRSASRSSARGPTPGSTRTGNGARNAASRPGRTTVSPPGLRRSDATFATTFEVATPSEHESRVRSRTTACTASASARASSNVGRDLAEVEVALVDPGLLDGRHDLADDRPDLARVLAVERHPRRHEDRVRAAAQRLGARHRRGDPEARARRSSRSRRRRARAGRRRRRAARRAAPGRSSSSTAAKNASRSRCATMRCTRVSLRDASGRAKGARDARGRR